MLTKEVRGPVAEPAAGRRHGRRVLLAFDGSPGSHAALERAIAVAADNRALLTIAAVVVEPKMCTGFGPAVVPYTRESMRRDIELEMQRHLATARDEVPATISVTTRVLYGNPAKALAALAAAAGCAACSAGALPTACCRAYKRRCSRYGRPSATRLCSACPRRSSRHGCSQPGSDSLAERWRRR